MLKFALAICLAFAQVPLAEARGLSSSPRSSSPRSGTRSTTTARSAPPASVRSMATKCTSCARDSRGRIARSTSAKHDFQKAHPCPATGKAARSCPGYVIDHVAPLKRGGADSPSNMQWQTKAAAKAKDKVA